MLIYLDNGWQNGVCGATSSSLISNVMWIQVEPTEGAWVARKPSPDSAEFVNVINATVSIRSWNEWFSAAGNCTSLLYINIHTTVHPTYCSWNSVSLHCVIFCHVWYIIHCVIVTCPKFFCANSTKLWRNYLLNLSVITAA